MSTGITGTDVLDLEISLAYVVLGGARGMWHRCPSAENARRIEDAEAELDRLLDRRLVRSRLITTLPGGRRPAAVRGPACAGRRRCRCTASRPAG